MPTVYRHPGPVQAVLDEDLDEFCLRELVFAAHYFAVESTPMLSHLVGLDRVVHVLAARVISRGPSHPQGSQLGYGQVRGPGRFLLRSYARAVGLLNAAIIAAARAGKVRIVDPYTGVVLPEIEVPSSEWLTEWERLAHDLSDGARERAINCMIDAPRFLGHFEADAAVAIDAFAGWTVEAGIATEGELIRLLAVRWGREQQADSLEEGVRTLSGEALDAAVRDLYDMPASDVGKADDPELPDPERRLGRLRHLGGDVRWDRGQWKVRGIRALIKAEVAEDRPRSSEKTVRGDLLNAAQAEKDAKREGTSGRPFPGT